MPGATAASTGIPWTKKKKHEVARNLTGIAGWEASRVDLLTSRAFERVARASAKRERAKVRAGSYHTRPENQANDFEKVYVKSFGEDSKAHRNLGH